MVLKSQPLHTAIQPIWRHMHLLNHYDVEPKILLTSSATAGPRRSHESGSPVELNCGSTPKTKPACADGGGGWSRQTCLFARFDDGVKPKKQQLWSLIHCPVLLLSTWFQNSRWATICRQVPSEVKNVHMLKGQKMSTDYNTLKLQFIFLLVKNALPLITA